MKVLLLNGSPHKEGCTYTALCEVEKTLNEAGIETEIFWIETKPLMSCTACLKCREKGECTFNKDKVNEFVKRPMMLMDSYSAHRFTMRLQPER